MERRSNLSTFTFLFVSLAVLKILRSGNVQINLAFCSTFRISDCVSDTPARQNASELAFALAYSYLWLAPKILRLGIIKLMLASALDFSYL